MNDGWITTMSEMSRRRCCHAGERVVCVGVLGPSFDGEYNAAPGSLRNLLHLILSFLLDSDYLVPVHMIREQDWPRRVTKTCRTMDAEVTRPFLPLPKPAVAKPAHIIAVKLQHSMILLHDIRFTSGKHWFPRPNLLQR